MIRVQRSGSCRLERAPGGDGLEAGPQGNDSRPAVEDAGLTVEFGGRPASNSELAAR